MKQSRKLKRRSKKMVEGSTNNLNGSRISKYSTKKKEQG